jgi:hypothetical protein
VQRNYTQKKGEGQDTEELPAAPKLDATSPSEGG